MGTISKKERMNVRFSPAQFQVLTELKEALNTSYSMLIRAIIGDFLKRNEDCLERIVENKNNIDLNLDDYADTDE